MPSSLGPFTIRSSCQGLSLQRLICRFKRFIEIVHNFQVLRGVLLLVPASFLALRP